MIDVNKPITNPELVKSINNFLTERTPENELILIDRITQAHFLVPIIMQGEVEDGRLKAGSTISFKMLTNNSGESFFMAFTDWQELSKWSHEKEETLISTYEDLKSIVLKDAEHVRGFVINPYGQNIVITPELMEYFSQRTSEIVVEKDTQVFLGQPAEFPQEMVTALTELFQNQPEVESAYLFIAQQEGEERSYLLLIIGFTGEKALLFPRIAAVAQGYLGEGEYLDLVPLDTEFGRNATKDATPFYKRRF